MSEQQPDDTQPSPDFSDQSGASARADFMAEATPEQRNAWLDDVAKFAPVMNGRLASEGITDDATIEYVKTLFAKAVTEQKANDAAAWTSVFVGDVMPKVRAWRAAEKRRQINESSDEDFKKYSNQVDKASHDKKRAQLRDRALALEEIESKRHQAAKSTDGRGVWDLSDEEFKAREERNKAIDRASMIERQSLAMDTLNLRLKEDRARRNAK